MKYLLLFILLFTSLTACKTSDKLPKALNSSTQTDFTAIYQPGPHVYVYKTKANYNNMIPITLSEDKKKIIGYPDPKDISIEGNYKSPSILKSDYLLDNMGISKNTVFLKLSYAEYAKLDSPPSLNEMFELIITDSPFLELYDCGLKSAFSDEVYQLNTIIKSNKMEETFRRIL